MTTATLAEVEATQLKLAAMIAELKAAIPTLFNVPAAQIELHKGERYAGVVLGADGMPTHHLVLLPGEAESVAWGAAKDWAVTTGGELPTRQEQALLYANLKSQFQAAWYWSGQEHETNGSYAWFQGFDDGNQNNGHKGYEGRARAVRRISA